ncbi:MAG: hypothetical protein HQ537_01700 [Parcubacteria group bacterium]|nr:hypothetical protein [Parcubacteria group bacterium]
MILFIGVSIYFWQGQANKFIQTISHQNNLRNLIQVKVIDGHEYAFDLIIKNEENINIIKQRAEKGDYIELEFVEIISEYVNKPNTISLQFMVYDKNNYFKGWGHAEIDNLDIFEVNLVYHLNKEIKQYHSSKNNISFSYLNSCPEFEILEKETIQGINRINLFNTSIIVFNKEKEEKFEDAIKKIALIQEQINDCDIKIITEKDGMHGTIRVSQKVIDNYIQENYPHGLNGPLFWNSVLYCGNYVEDNDEKSGYFLYQPENNTNKFIFLEGILWGQEPHCLIKESIKIF